VEIGLVLFIITLMVNAASRAFIWSLGRRTGRGGPARGRAGGGGGLMANARRKIVSHLIVGLCGAAVLVSLVPLVLILFYVLKQGRPRSPGRSSRGCRAARRNRRRDGERHRRIVDGDGLGAIFAIPIGVIAGVYASEYAARGSPTRSASPPTRSTACRRSSSASSPTAWPCCRSTTSPALAAASRSAS
jgi:hypothetical protein